MLLCLLFLLTFRYSVKTPFGIVTIEPSSKKQNKRVKSDSSSSKALKNDAKDSMFSVMMKRLMNRNGQCSTNDSTKDCVKKQEDRNVELPYPTGVQAREQDLMFPTNKQQ